MGSKNLKDDTWFMKIAMEEAEQAFRVAEVPVGAVIVDEIGTIVGRSHNQKEEKNDPTSHAEIEAIRLAASKAESWRLQGHTLYVTLEPCPMCLYAAMQARLKKIVFGAYDSKGGALSLGYYLFNDSRFNHRLEIAGGIEHYSCSELLSQFFRLRRKPFRGY